LQDKWSQTTPEWLATSEADRAELSQALRTDAGNYNQQVGVVRKTCLVCMNMEEREKKAKKKEKEK
jgi:hypothetical protein